MSVFEGLLKGYLGAKIANTEANDRLKANVLESAGENFYTNILPQAIENENVRRENYDMLAAEDPNLAELADINGFTASKAAMKRFADFREVNKLKDPDALKNLRFETDFNTRYNTRVKSFEEKYNPILNQIGIKELGGLGFNTVESLVGGKNPGEMKTEDMAKGPAPSDTFASTQLTDYFTPKPDEATEGSQFRLRKNDVIKQAVTASGLNAKFSNNPDGSLSVTDIDEASQNKFQLVTEYSSDMFANSPNRTDYINIGNEAATRVTALESLAKNGNTAINNYFQSHIQKAPKVDGKVDYTSEEKVYPLNDGTMVNAREVFERQNADLIRAYIMGSVTQKNFIREKFDKSGRGYSVFFDQIDDALDQQENS